MSKSIEFLRQLAERLQTQDNCFTASPNYCIQEYRCITGIDQDYTDQIGWFDTDGGSMASDEEAATLEAGYDEDGTIPDGWIRTGYDWQWRCIGVSFLTKDAADAFVSSQRHNYRDGLRVYVDSHYRNAEMREVRRLLAGPLVACLELLNEARNSLAIGLETPGELEADWSIEDRELVARIDSALAALDTAKEPHQ